MGNAHRVYWLRFHESRLSSSQTPDSLDPCAQATKARNARAALERHPDTIGVRARAHSPLSDAVSHARWRGQTADLEFQPKRACLRSKLRVLRVATPPPGPPSGTTSSRPKSYKFLRGSGDTRSAAPIRLPHSVDASALCGEAPQRPSLDTPRELRSRREKTQFQARASGLRWRAVS